MRKNGLALLTVAAVVLLASTWLVSRSRTRGQDAAPASQSLSPSPVPAAGVAAKPDPGRQRKIVEAFGKLPLHFIENRGQVDARVAYYVQGRDTTVYFTPEGVTLALTQAPTPEQRPGAQHSVQKIGLTPPQEARGQRWVVKLDFVGANPDVKAAGHGPTLAPISYFKGDRADWKTGLKTYGSLIYRDVWPGIDLVYEGTQDRLKYRFELQPGADPGRIRLAYRGATGVHLTEEGQLAVSTPVGGFHDETPRSYQEIDGRQVEVATDYALEKKREEGRQEYGFKVGRYDRNRPLVLDPAVLMYAGYIGGVGNDQVSGIAVDSSGNAYVTGTTDSSEASFPATVGPDTTFNGSSDAFVAKIDAAGTGLVYCGYIGGNSADRGLGIAVDSDGNAYVAGHAASTQVNFPVTVGPDLTHNGGIFDAFVAKVSPEGTGLIYCGYIGGSRDDLGRGIAVDSAAAPTLPGTPSPSSRVSPSRWGRTSPTTGASRMHSWRR